MAGTKKGSLMKKLGLKGKTKPGQMISRMNSMKAGSASGVGRIEKAKAVTKGIKKTGKFEGKSNKLGGGGRFKQVVAKVSKEKGVKNPKALAAFIGRKSLGKAKFQKLAAKGKKNG